MNNYPTIPEVENASIRQLCQWYRFLPSPGTRSIGKTCFDIALETESDILGKIMKRMEQLGGITTKISKEIGW